MMINKYINQLEYYAKKHDVSLIQMFKLAKVPTSTYYRAKNKNKVDLRFDTASKVAKAIRTIPIPSKSCSH